jgi:O-antigen/teichoic acid export membrane protein
LGWLYGYRWIERLFDVVSTVVLTSILSLDDFGLVAIAASSMVIIYRTTDPTSTVVPS